ncbi:tumor necrosis factor receptor superfamily member 11B-like isoform X2 [Oncorhynchus tshawytscha]|uniref:tumor necrosis factor receptor superfamily member 11B-like isoform X1 n=1 Tax=Oncorhynchus tshawytscha TaxID=74940 RepID=UPI001C3C58D2|nr:tumor necrosis factor receptor superfamily member 11B-like isoform X1 [Oncorhynchus tshawytscha]XP_042170492.1 tumor necrosis factor receptor superfamily member 11B-like isoform X2 [Oncorhynchus tshawytscha]
MSANSMRPQPAMKLHVLFAISFSWAFHEVPPPKYQHYDPLTSELLLCDQCPPGTAVLTHCTAETPTACSPCPDRSFSEHWHWGDSCQYCTTVCKERQLVSQECNRTHDQLCECIPGYHLVVEFCIKHTSCPPGFGVTALDVSLCEEAIFQSLASLRLSSVPLERLLESLPGKRVDRKSLERLKKACSPQQQILLLLRLWREQNKDQVKLYGIIQGVNHCERKVSRCAGLKNLTLGDLMMVMKSLPGVRAHEEDIRAVVSSCRSQQYLLQLLHLWKNQNKDLDINKGLAHSLSRLRQQGHHARSSGASRRSTGSSPPPPYTRCTRRCSST